ncbi:hypothetical protein V1286_003620 [Bradyrhizobium algeriense]|uniref:DUF86 domain-containing protein n=1 Tax=Bradyrhizobium algeriense TaxID=634784 RepID=A0ABU8BC12_9BRAD
MATVEQVYHDAGRALEAANLLETELGTCLLALDALETGSYANPDADAYARLREAIDSNTLGRSIRAIKAKLQITDSVDAVFQDALEARNLLAHRFFPHHGLKVHDPAGRDEMVAHIDRLRDAIWSAYTIAGKWSPLLVAAVRVLMRAKAN